MIAALASGLLGQIEGIGSVADGVSAIGSLFDTGATTRAVRAQTGATQNCHCHGHVHAAHPLSDQVQSLLLQQQSASDET